MKKPKTKFIVIISIAASLVFYCFIGRYLLLAGFFIYEFLDIDFTNIDGMNMTFVQDYNGSSGASWEYELIPEGKIELTGEDRRVIFISPAGEDIWHFKAVEPGEFTMVWFSYNSGLSLDVKKSYAQDYLVSENLQIEKVGKRYPIAMVHDSITITESMERTRSYIEKLLNEESDYSNAKFNVTYDTSLRKINIAIFNTDYNEKELKIYTHDFVLEKIRYKGLFYKYSVTVSIENPIIENQKPEEPLVYSDDEETLKKTVTLKNKELFFWKYGDFDSNGRYEALAFAGNDTAGTIYLVNSDGITELYHEYTDVEISSFTFDKYTFFSLVYDGVANYSMIWGVDENGVYDTAISKVGQYFSIDENGDMIIIHSTFDNITFGEGHINGAHTWKPYYFYYDNGFHEYGGTGISLDELLSYENADSFIGQIKNEGGEITNILKRANGIININYTVYDPDAKLKWNYNITISEADGKVSLNNKSLREPAMNEGVYLPAMVPGIAVYQ